MSDMFDVSKKSSMKSIFSKNSNYIKGIFYNTTNTELSPILVYTLRSTLILVLLSLLYTGLPLPIAQTMDNVFIRISLVIILVFLTMVEPVSAVLLLALFCYMYYDKEKMRLRLQTLKHESFRGGLQGYASIGTDSNEQQNHNQNVDFVKSNVEGVEMNSDFSTFAPTSSTSASSTSTSASSTSTSSPCTSTIDNTITFTPSTISQFDRIQTNIVGDEDSLNTEVRTWIDEAGPQGMSYPSGFPLDNGGNTIDNVDMLTPF